jgi:hypothetical protein
MIQARRRLPHTHGLHRCGRPELEMLEVPQRYVRTAADLLEAIAARSLDMPESHALGGHLGCRNAARP